VGTIRRLSLVKRFFKLSGDDSGWLAFVFIELCLCTVELLFPLKMFFVGMSGGC
jgi:hypothetical protein